MMPDGKALVLTSSNVRPGVRSAKKRFREPTLEQRRCQRGAAPEDEVRAVQRLDAAKPQDDVRAETLERSPLKTFRTVSSDILPCCIEAVRHRTARRLWPEARPEIVGATTK